MKPSPLNSRGYADKAHPRFSIRIKRTLEGSPIIGVGAPLQGAFILSFSLSAGSANLRLLRGDAFSVNPPLSPPIKGRGWGWGLYFYSGMTCVTSPPPLQIQLIHPLGGVPDVGLQLGKGLDHAYQHLLQGEFAVLVSQVGRLLRVDIEVDEL